MSGKKKLPQKNVSITRSSAAEYLTFVAAGGEGGIEAIYAGENVWLTQKMMATLYDVDVRTVNYHLKKIFGDNELEEDAVIRNFRITAADGKTYDTKHYSLKAIIAVGYKVNSERAVQFRKWATGVVSEFAIKAYVMDDERLKSGSVLTAQYFEEQLARIREIRMSERKFYQKITDNGTELNAILPRMSPLNPQYLTKKQSAFQRIAAFVEKFKGVGGSV